MVILRVLTSCIELLLYLTDKMLVGLVSYKNRLLNKLFFKYYKIINWSQTRNYHHHMDNSIFHMVINSTFTQFILLIAQVGFNK